MSTDSTNILVVDDLPEKLLVYRSILDELGQNLVTAKSGEEALAHVLATDFAVILLDVQMPRMNGFETAAMIRKRKKSAHTPIIFLTAFADEVRAAEGYAHGAVDYISTPVVPAILRAKVRVFVELYRMAEQVRRQADERVALVEERAKRTAAEEANRRLDFLARAGAVLGQSLDHEVTARDAASLPVPFLADEVALLVAGNGPAVEVGNPGPRVRAAAEQALADGRAVAEGDDLLALPLAARGRTFAGLALRREGRAFEPADRIVVEAFASRAASALDNALLHRGLEDANRQKNEFLAMLAHELRNPLAPIQNATEVLALRGDAPDRVKWAREVIGRQAGHLTRIVDDLLDVSRITQGKIRLRIEPVEVGAVVAAAVEATRPLVEQSRHTLDVSCPSEQLCVKGDPDRLTQVVVNLLGNAAKYTAEGGRIWLRVAAEQGRVAVSVRDTGIGLSPDMLSAVFGLFTQVDRSLDRAQGGLGIGLTLVHRLVEMHGGTVAAFSEGSGKGCEFVVRLPLAAPPAATHPPPARAVPGRVRAGGLRVVLVDDNADAADSLADLLGLAGYEVEVAYDGPAGLEAARRSRPDILILDIGLPGLDGYEVARRVRADPALSPVTLVAISGYGREEDRRTGREVGFDRHFVKPVEFAALRDYLDSLPIPRPRGASVVA